MKYCPYCGTELDNSMAFCHKCGKSQDYTSVGNSSIPNSEKKFLKIPIICGIALIVAAVAILFIFKFKPSVISADSETTSEQSINYDELSKSVVKLECYAKSGDLYCTGSGVVVFDSQTVVTNYHVISGDCYTIKVISDDNQEALVTGFKSYSEEKDLAILQLENPTNIKPLEIGSLENLKRGDSVSAIGSPLGLLNTVSTGIVSGFYKDGEINAIQTTAAISSGSSGGALIDNDGKLIGITYSGFEPAENIGLAIPMNDVLAVLSIKGRNYSINDFYSLIWHDFDLGYILNNSNSPFDVKTKVKIKGYVSSIYMVDGSLSEIFIVPDYESVLGIIVDYTPSPPSPDDPSALGKLLTEGNRYQNSELQSEVEHLKSHISVAAPVTNVILDRTIKPGSYITVKGHLSTVLDNFTRIQVFDINLS